MALDIFYAGEILQIKGKYIEAFEYFNRSSKIFEIERESRNNPKEWLSDCFKNMGVISYKTGNLDSAIKYLERSVKIQNDIGYKGIKLESSIFLNLIYKKLKRNYNNKEIHILIGETDYIGFHLNLMLYDLLEEKHYLDKAYNQIHEKASEMEEDLARKFLIYPNPREIIEEWGKVNKSNSF